MFGDGNKRTYILLEVKVCTHLKTYETELHCLLSSLLIGLAIKGGGEGRDKTIETVVETQPRSIKRQRDHVLHDTHTHTQHSR